jgi:hypothetical protein
MSASIRASSSVIPEQVGPPATNATHPLVAKGAVLAKRGLNGSATALLRRVRSSEIDHDETEGDE